MLFEKAALAFLVLSSGYALYNALRGIIRPKSVEEVSPLLEALEYYESSSAKRIYRGLFGLSYLYCMVRFIQILITDDGFGGTVEAVSFFVFLFGFSIALTGLFVKNPESLRTQSEEVTDEEIPLPATIRRAYYVIIGGILTILAIGGIAISPGLVQV